MRYSEHDIQKILENARLAGEDDEEMRETIIAAALSKSNALNNLSNYLKPTAILDPKIFRQANDSVTGLINFCTTENNLEAGIYLCEPHGLIAGQSGCGKSHLLLHMLSKTMSNARVWFFSRSKEGRRLLAFSNEILVNSFDGKIEFNPLLPAKNVSLSAWINTFCDVFIQSMGLYDGTKSFLIEILHEIFQKNKVPTIKDLYFYIKSKKFPAFSRFSRYQESALNRIAPILFSDLGTSFCSIISFDAFMDKHLVFELQSLTAEQKVLTSNLLLDYLFFYKLNNDVPHFHFVGVDDCHWLFDIQFERRVDRGVPVISDLLSTIRKSKVNVFAVSQVPSQLSTSVHSNSFTKILMNLTNTRDISCMVQNMGITDTEQIKRCQKLDRRETVVKFASRYQEAFLARVPELSFKEFSDEEVQRNNERVIRVITLKAEDIGDNHVRITPGDERHKSKDDVTDEEASFLWDIYNRPYVSITERYETINLGG
ncbi:MAG: hypothetical protein WBB67_12195 [bacterium]